MLDAIFDATAQIDTYYCTRLLPGRYKRANVPLSGPVALNDYSENAITVMTDSTMRYTQSSSEWADIQTWIETNFG